MLKYLILFFIGIPGFLAAQASDTIPWQDIDLASKPIPPEVWDAMDLTPKPVASTSLDDLGWMGPAYKDPRKFPWWTLTPLAGVPVVFLLLEDEPVPAPVIECGPDVTLPCGETVPSPDIGTVVVNSDCPDGFTVTFVSDVTTGAGYCAENPQVTTRTYEVSDACGNTTSCQQTFTYTADLIPPTATCPEDILLEWGSDIPPADISLVTVTDNCASPNELIVSHTGDVDNGGNACAPTILEIVRTYQASDVCGNTTACEQVIRFIPDEEAPAITCPPEASVECGQQDDISITGLPDVSDNVTPPGDIALTYEDDVSGLNDCGGTGTLLRTWTATDECGNTQTCVQTILVEDLTAPILECPADVTVDCGEQDQLNITGTATAADNCTQPDEIDITYEDDLSSFSGCEGTIIRTWTAVDACGNATLCEQLITVLEVDCDFSVTVEEIPPDCGQSNGTITTEVQPSGDYTWAWSTGEETSGISDLPAGEYSVTITDTVAWCSEVLTVVLIEAVPAYVEIVDVGAASCNVCGEIVVDLTGAGPFTVNLEGPVNLNISNITPGQLDLGNFDCLPAGPYTLTVTDQSIGGNCQDIELVVVPLEPYIELVVFNTIPPSLPGLEDGSIEMLILTPDISFPAIVLVNGQFYSEINDPVFTIEDLGEGIYTIEVIDANGCISDPVTVQLFTIPGFTLSFLPETGMLMPDYPRLLSEVFASSAELAVQLQEALPEHPLPEVEELGYAMNLPMGLTLGRYWPSGWLLELGWMEQSGMAMHTVSLGSGVEDGETQSDFRLRTWVSRLRYQLRVDGATVQPSVGLSFIHQQLQRSGTRVFWQDQSFMLQDADKTYDWNMGLIMGMTYRPDPRWGIRLEGMLPQQGLYLNLERRF